MADWGPAEELGWCDEQMDRHLAHERRRLRVVAAVLVAMAALMALGHAVNDAAGRSLLPLGVMSRQVGQSVDRR